jgi:hypothetical protein
VVFVPNKKRRKKSRRFGFDMCFLSTKIRRRVTWSDAQCTRCKHAAVFLRDYYTASATIWREHLQTTAGKCAGLSRPRDSGFLSSSDFCDPHKMAGNQVLWGNLGLGAIFLVSKPSLVLS